MTTNKLMIETLRDNQHLRQSEIYIGDKKFETPFYLSKIKKSFELDLYLNKFQELNNAKGVVYDILNFHTVTDSKEREKRQTQLFGGGSVDFYAKMKKEQLITVDPNTEYFYYNSSGKRGSFLKHPNLERTVYDLLINSNTKNHHLKWEELSRNKRLAPMVSWYITESLRADADVIIPPSPLIDGVHTNLIDATIQVNKTAQLLIETFEIHPSRVATYFNFNNSAFSNNTTQLQKLIEYLYDDSDGLNQGKTVFIKVTNYDFLRDSVARENYSIFLSALSTICHSKNKKDAKSVFLLDGRTLGLVSTMAGLDGFIEPLDNTVKDIRGASTQHTQHGQLYDENDLVFIKHKIALQRYIDRGRIFNSHTKTAKQYNNRALEDMPAKLWNNMRRNVLLESRNNEFNEVKKAFFNHPRGFADKIYNSKVKDYIDILPNGF